MRWWGGGLSQLISLHISDEEDRLVPISGRLNQVLLPESDRVLEEAEGGDEEAPLADPVKEEPDADRDTEDGLVIALPVADRVADAKVSETVADF